MSDSDKRPGNEPDFEDMLEDLGKSAARFMQKIFEKGEEIFENAGMDDLFRSPTPTERGPKRDAQPHHREPAVDLFDEGDAIVVYVELPGAEEDTIEVSVEGAILYVNASAGRETFAKTIELPAKVKGKAKQQFKNGILKVELHKAKAAR